MASLHLDWLTQAETLAKLAREWQALATRQAESTGLFATPAWVQTYWAQYAPQDAGVLTVRQGVDGPLLAVAPLQVFNLQHESRSYRAARPVGATFAPYVEWPMASYQRREAINALLNQGMREHLKLDLVFIGALHERSPLYLTLLEDLRASSALKTWRFPRNLHEIETRGRTLAAHQRLCSSKTFKAARYALRRLEREQGPVVWDAPTSAQVKQQLVTELCALEQQHFGRQHAQAHRPEWPQLMGRLAALDTPDITTEVMRLRVNQQTAVISLGVRYKQRYYYLTSRYPPSFVPYSVNKLLQAHLIERSFERQELFCFGAGNYAYKRDWAPTVGELKCALVFFNPAARQALDATLTPSSFPRFVAF